MISTVTKMQWQLNGPLRLHLCYRPQRSWGKVIFSQASVNRGVSALGGMVSQHSLRLPRPDTPLGADMPHWSRHPPEQTTPPGNRHPLGANTPQEQTPPRADIPPEQTPPGADTLLEQTPPPGGEHAARYSQRAGGMHPTGMQSCYKYVDIQVSGVQGQNREMTRVSLHGLFQV